MLGQRSTYRRLDGVVVTAAVRLARYTFHSPPPPTLISFRLITPKSPITPSQGGGSGSGSGSGSGTATSSHAQIACHPNSFAFIWIPCVLVEKYVIHLGSARLGSDFLL